MDTFKAGDTLENGATVIAYNNVTCTVLALNSGATCPYVVWSVGVQGYTHTGHYFKTIESAVDHFNS